MPAVATAQAPPAQPGGTLTAYSHGDPDTLDPGSTYSSGGFWIASATQRPLLSYAPGDPLNPVPDLAAAAPVVSGDRRTVTVTLRAGVRFSPPVGREVTSADVKYAIERGFFRTVATPYAPAYFGVIRGARPGVAPGTEIRGIETPDDRTVVLRLSRPAGGIVAAALVMPLTAPVPPEVARPLDDRRRSAYATRQAATGPYMLAADAAGVVTGYRRGRSIELVRNPSWDRATDRRPALLDGVMVDTSPPDDALTRILEGRQAISGDFLPDPAGLRRALREHPDQTEPLSGGGVAYLALNTSRPPFDDPDVRRAVAAGFDRLGVRRIMGGRPTGPLATHFLPPDMPGFREAGGRRGPAPQLYGDPRGDRAAAARFLRAAGHRSGRFQGRPIVVAGPDDSPALEAGTRFEARQLERLGFDVRLRLAPFGRIARTICGDPRKRVDACANLGWFRDFPDPQTVLDPLFNGANITPRGNSNVSQLDVPALNRAMRRAALVVGADARGRAWGAIDRRVTRRAAMIPIAWPTVTLMASPDVRGVANPAVPGWDLAYTGVAP